MPRYQPRPQLALSLFAASASPFPAGEGARRTTPGPLRVFRPNTLAHSWSVECCDCLAAPAGSKANGHNEAHPASATTIDAVVKLDAFGARKETTAATSSTPVGARHRRAVDPGVEYRLVPFRVSGPSTLDPERKFAALPSAKGRRAGVEGNLAVTFEDFLPLNQALSAVFAPRENCATSVPVTAHFYGRTLFVLRHML